MNHTLLRRASLGGLALGSIPTLAFAGEVDSGDTAFMLVSSALVLMMTLPGLAFFYGGLVRSKNALSTMMHSMVMLGIATVVWVLFGYSLAFGDSVGGLFGNPLQYFALSGVGLEADGPADTIPHQLFMVFQMMFAIITPALISGAIAERMKFSAYVIFVTLWVSFIYAPLCHWVWGGGWIGTHFEALDFAGGTVVHISSGVSALVACLVLGPRRGHGNEPMAPHNLPFTVLGAGLLWVGWFGFNAGSALAANGSAAAAFVNTHVAAGTAVLAWMLTEWLMHGKPTVLGGASGAVAGLVAITPAAGFVTPLGSMAIGFGGGVVCYLAVTLKSKLGYDDSLDVVGIHGAGGTWGALATGVFAAQAVGGTAGMLEGNVGIIVNQSVGVLATIAFAGIGTFLFLKIIDAIVGLRVDDDAETSGLDLSQHSEQAYTSSG